MYAFLITTLWLAKSAFGNALAVQQNPLPASMADSTLTSHPSAAPKKTVVPELKVALNESGSAFFRVTFLNQTWLRLNQNNPGTTVMQAPEAQSLDIGLRRTRIQMYGQLNDRTMVYFQFGMNNFNFLNAFPSYNTNGTPANRKVGAFFHDAVSEYTVIRGANTLKLGGGLTIVNGLSRFSQPSVSTIMTMDVPVFAQATVDQTDEFSRKLSIYARGQVGKLDYRFALSDPFPINTNGAAPPALNETATFSQRQHRKQYQGMLIYQFLDKEPNQTPGYMTGTYLGKKRIFNLEAGFIGQQNAMWRKVQSDTVYQNLRLWSVAAFLDMPLNSARQTAISAYLGYFNTDYGTNYLRFNGIMNPGSGTTASLPGLSGTQGNAFPMFGTGHVWYSQLGFLAPVQSLGLSLLPYASAQISEYQRLAKTLGVYNVGVNFLLSGHNSKLTVDYQNRPYYRAAGTLLQPDGRRGQLTLQYQVFI